MAPRKHYGNHPMGTRGKSDINRGARLRWRERLTDGREYPVTVTRVKAVSA